MFVYEVTKQKIMVIHYRKCEACIISWYLKERNWKERNHFLSERPGMECFPCLTKIRVSKALKACFQPRQDFENYNLLILERTKWKGRNLFLSETPGMECFPCLTKIRVLKAFKACFQPQQDFENYNLLILERTKIKRKESLS